MLVGLDLSYSRIPSLICWTKCKFWTFFSKTFLELGFYFTNFLFSNHVQYFSINRSHHISCIKKLISWIIYIFFKKCNCLCHLFWKLSNNDMVQSGEGTTANSLILETMAPEGIDVSQQQVSTNLNCVSNYLLHRVPKSFLQIDRAHFF